MKAALRRRLQNEIGRRIRDVKPVAGGDINEAYRVYFDTGAPLFVKTHGYAPQGMYPTEAAGLRWLSQANAMRVPEVVGCSDDNAPDCRFLALEWIEAGQPAVGFDEVVGQRLAALHASGAPGFGLATSNFIGRLSQHNTAHPDWASFYWSERLEPQVRRAADRGHLAPGVVAQFGKLASKLENLVGEREPPARLHGDLWSGNLFCDNRGEPVLVDPAVYGGHREMDLAMMRLFGGFGPRVFAAYNEASPVSPGADERVLLCQLYPLLVHVNLFGSGYVGQVVHALAGYV